MISEQTQETIDDIMDNFDYEKVHEVMDFLEWKWALDDGCCVPSINDLRRRSRQLMKEVVSNLERNEEYNVSTGGFTVRGWRAPDDGKIFLELSFVLTNWDNYE